MLFVFLTKREFRRWLTRGQLGRWTSSVGGVGCHLTAMEAQSQRPCHETSNRTLNDVCAIIRSTAGYFPWCRDQSRKPLIAKFSRSILRTHWVQGHAVLLCSRRERWTLGKLSSRISTLRERSRWRLALTMCQWENSWSWQMYSSSRR